ncbi:uncharacterized protein TNCV_1687511 [Trichonephila clavipes]|nr:uncharacterized protein TNCV_1687511 [Trichonephila clavipes]
MATGSYMTPIYSRSQRTKLYIRLLYFIPWAVGSLVVRASDFRPEGLGSMPVPPNTLRVHTEYVLVKSVGPKVLWVESRVQETRENFPPLQFHA